jgi:DNA polymerase
MRIVVLDFESYYDQDYSLSKMTTESYIRDHRFEVIGVSFMVVEDGVVTTPKTWVSGSKDRIELVLLGLDIPNSYLLCQHTAFDGAILNWHFGIKPKFYLDTLSMSRPVTGMSVGGSLEMLARYYKLPPKGKEVTKAIGKHRWDFTDSELYEYGEYCKHDTWLCYEIFKKLEHHTTARELYIIDLMLRMFIDPVIELDVPILKAHLADVIDRKDRLMAKLASAGITKDDLMSNDKMAAVLLRFGVDPPRKISVKKTQTAQKKEDAAALAEGRVACEVQPIVTYAFSKQDVAFKELLEHPDEKVQAVVAARLGVKSTLEETRTDALIGIASRGSLAVLLNYYGAHTGRASGGDKINLQNLPARAGNTIRTALKAPPGHGVVACDSSQIEARIVAYLAGQWDLVNDFANGVDIYSKFATGVFGYEVNKEDNPQERFVGKTCILGLGFGTGAVKLQHTLKVTPPFFSTDLGFCESAVGFYRNQYAEIKKLWKSADEAIRAMILGFEYELGVGIKLRCSKDGIQLPNGMWLRYPGLHRDENGDYMYLGRNKKPVYIYGAKLIENVVQALARIVVFEQMARIDQKLRKYDTAAQRFRVVLTVHDEVVVVVPEWAVEKTKEMMVRVMSTPPRWAAKLPIACEAGSGLSYGDAK